MYTYMYISIAIYEDDVMSDETFIKVVNNEMKYFWQHDRKFTLYTVKSYNAKIH